MPTPVQLIRFGVFELDLDTNELRKNGRKLKLQEQPFRLLNLLIETPGQPVSRDRLKEALWSGDTFVDFDHSLNAAIAKLRQALGDPAENPRFVETVARKGYRFIAPVEFVGNSVGRLSEVSSPVAEEAPTPTSVLAQFSPSVGPRANSKLITFLCACLAVTAFAFWSWRPMPMAEIQMIRLTNESGLNIDPAISPDGKLVAYASDRGSTGNLNIWLQQLVSGGSAVQLTHDSVDADQPTFSPDGTKIAFHSKRDGGGIYLIPVIGGETSPLVHSGRSPRFSPDGRWVAYSSGAVTGGGVFSGNGSGGVFVVAASGGEPQRLGLDLAGPASPVWSPDSRHLLVYVPPEMGFIWNNADWWLVSLDGKPSRRTGNFGELKRQGFSLGFDRIPTVAEWSRDLITFAAGFGDAVNIWRAPISNDGRISGSASRITSGTALEVEPTSSAGGNLIFASLNRSSAVWSLMLDTDVAKLGGEIQRTTNGPAEIMPSISTDGVKVAYTAARGRANFGVTDAALPEATDLRTRVKDLSDDKDTVFLGSGGPQWHPQISRDGSKVSYTAGKPGKLFVAPSIGGPPRLLLGGENCFSWDWSVDNKRLLYSAGANIYDQRVHMLDVSSGREKLLISKPGSAFFQAKFSPDDQAIAVLGCRDNAHAAMECQIFIVPLENNVAATPERWIAINHSGQWDDKPRWSPSGGVLYFISDRDGYLCLWAQRLDVRTKYPIGLPFAVYHLHNTKLAMSNLDTGFLEIGVAKNRIVLGLGELTGDIWRVENARVFGR